MRCWHQSSPSLMKAWLGLLRDVRAVSLPHVVGRIAEEHLAPTGREDVHLLFANVLVGAFLLPARHHVHREAMEPLQRGLLVRAVRETRLLGHDRPTDRAVTHVRRSVSPVADDRLCPSPIKVAVGVLFRPVRDRADDVVLQEVLAVVDDRVDTLGRHIHGVALFDREPLLPKLDGPRAADDVVDVLLRPRACVAAPPW